MQTSFEQKVIEAIKAIPPGKISTYGEIAKQAGNNKGAQEVSDILHHKSDEFELPWHRVINSKGEIAFNDPKQIERQRRLLEKEGIEFLDEKTLNLQKYLHTPNQPGLDNFF